MIVAETLPKSYLGSINSTFYLCIAAGVQMAVFVKGKFAQDRYYVILCLPIILELIRMGLYLVFFNVETPRFVYISNLKKLKKESTESQDDENDMEEKMISENNQLETIDKEFIEDSRIKNFLKVFYDDSLHEDTIRELNEEYKKQNKGSNENVSVLKTAFSKQYLKQTIIGFLLNYNNQLCGINVIVFYSTNLFKKLELSDPELLTMIVTLFNVLGGFLNIFILDRLGRKKLLSMGMVSISVSYILTMIGDCFNIPVFIPIGNCLFMVSFAMSLGGVLYVYQVEILPGEVIPLVSNSQWIFTLLISYYCLPLINSIGIYSMYFIFFFSTFISWFVFAGMSVESKGKTLSQMKLEYSKKKFWA